MRLLSFLFADKSFDKALESDGLLLEWKKNNSFSGVLLLVFITKVKAILNSIRFEQLKNLKK